MGNLRILGAGESVPAKANARGKLFETLMASVLRQLGYKIDEVPSRNYSGMEIDIVGRSIATQTPLYAECKFYETALDSTKLQAFLGKYTTRWLHDKRCQGLFLAVPGVNPHAKGFYDDNLASQREMTVRLVEEEEVLSSIFESHLVCRPETAMQGIPSTAGKPGDWLLAYTDRGFFFVFFVVPPGSAIPKKIAIFDSQGKNIYSDETIEYIRDLDHELVSLDVLRPELVPSPMLQGSKSDPEEIVEVQGSSSCFEYQFPASPEFFVGRDNLLKQVELLASEVISRTTSARGILFEGNSGFGKSSMVLSAVARLNAAGHFAVSIDCRSASSPQFALRAVSHVLERYDTVGGSPERSDGREVLGLESASGLLVRLGTQLSPNRRIIFIFFDQFENLFFLPDALRPIRDLFLKIAGTQTNVVLGFSWKADLFGITTEFPYQMRDAIAEGCRRISLGPFSEPEAGEMLQRLSKEIHAKLRNDLRFFLSEFSQGYPWLLKKLCAHVKQQREAGVQQAEIANSLLNVEQLFKEDLKGLSPEQEETLRRIAKCSPMSIYEYGDQFKPDPDVLQSLVNKRLIIRVGTKIDIYWDIFKDYLNSGSVPIQENYIPRIQVGSVLKVAELLNKIGPNIEVGKFRTQAGLSEKSFYNMLKDLRLLGIARLEAGEVQLQLVQVQDPGAFETALRAHVKERILRNRIVRKLLDKLETDSTSTIDDSAKELEKACPYLLATKATWRTYARVLADWMDYADLAIFDPKSASLQRYRPGTEVRQRTRLARAKQYPSAGNMPGIQYTPVFDACIRIANAYATKSGVDLSGMKPSTATKAVATLEDLGFIVRKPKSLQVTPKMFQFIQTPESRAQLFADSAISMEAFAAFVAILGEDCGRRPRLLDLGRRLSARLGAEWRDGTAETVAKILLDWARHTGFAPAPFTVARKGRIGVNDNQSELMLGEK
jgi:hypothetical protein